MKITTIEQFSQFYPPIWLENRVVCNDSLRDLQERIGTPDPDNFWIWREALRLLYGEYLPIPHGVLDLDGCIDLNPATRNHYLHVAKRDALLVAYTESPEQGRRDIQTVIKMGKYIGRYFSELDARRIANHFHSHMFPPDLKFARTREEIRKVYDNGPQSCMKGKRITTRDGESISPTEVYAGPDTAVAYLGSLYNVTARCVVNEVRRKWVRIYGDDSYLKEALEKAGYSCGSLQDCRVLYFEQEYDNRPIMPYLDNVNGCYIDPGEYNEYVIITDDDPQYICDQQDGTVSNPDEEDKDTVICICCDESYPDEAEGYNIGHGWVCQYCLDNSYTHAYTGRYREFIPNDDEMWEYNGEYYTLRGLETHNLVAVDDVVYELHDVVDDFFSGDLIVLEDCITVRNEAGDEGYTNPSDLDPRYNALYFNLEEGVVYVDVTPQFAEENNLVSSDDLLTLYPHICEDRYVLEIRHPDANFARALTTIIIQIISHEEHYHRRFCYHYLVCINDPVYTRHYFFPGHQLAA